MKQPFRSKLEALLLILIGVGAGGFALSPAYPALMNPKFQLLTLIGAVLVLLMGIAIWRYNPRRHLSGLLVFLLFFMIVLVGKPWTQGDLLLAPELSEFGGFSDPDYPLVDLKALECAVEDGTWPLSDGFTVLGVIKHLPEDESQSGNITLMRSIMLCCAADAVAYGFRVQAEALDRFNEGDWVVVSGKIKPLPQPDPVSPFRLATATYSVVAPAHSIEPKRVLSSKVLLPTLHGQLSIEQLGLFVQGLELTGLWETLGGPGPYTVLAPVNQAMEAIGYGELDRPFSETEVAVLRNRLSQHIIPGDYATLDLFERDTLTTLNQGTLAVETHNGRIVVDKSRLLFKDKNTRNGVVHMIYPALETSE